MATPPTSNAKTDLDLVQDVHNVIIHYPPTNADRRQIHVAVRGGLVTLSGYVQTPINRRYLVDNIRILSGITGVDVAGLHDDETIRFEVGRILPDGVIANVRYGAVTLSGDVPGGDDGAALLRRIAGLTGVVRVIVLGR